MEHAFAPRSGKIVDIFFKPGSVINPQQSSIARIEYCPHSVVFKGICAICGESAQSLHFSETANAIERIPVAYNSTQLAISRAEAESRASINARHLLDSNRLSLVLDLDHTLLHATDDPFTPSLIPVFSPNVDVQSVKTFQLEPTQNSKEPALMHVKFRQHLFEFLNRVSQKFELHIYTMGTRPYADQIAHLIDPEKKLFGGRITSREDFAEGRCNQKSIERLFPCDDSMVLIVDDREDVWISATGQSFMPNLLQAEPYHFWSGLHETYDRGASSSIPTQPVAKVRPLISKSADAQNLDNACPKPGKQQTTGENRDQPPVIETSTVNTSDTEMPDIAKPSEKNLEMKSSKVTNQNVADLQISKSIAVSEGGLLPVPSQTEKVNVTTPTEAPEKSLATPNETPANPEKVSSQNAGDRSPDSNGKSNDSERKPSKPSTPEEKSNISMPRAEKGSEKDFSDTEMKALVERFRLLVNKWWETDEDPAHSNHLLRLASVLEECHSRFFSIAEQKRKKGSPSVSNGALKRFRPPADVKKILAEMRREVLRDCVITFTGVIPTGINPQTSSIWNLAARLGARCSIEFENGYTTHLVASEERGKHTKKFMEASMNQTVFVVPASWIEDSAMNFEKKDEFIYQIDRDKRFKHASEYKEWIQERHKTAAKARKKRELTKLYGNQMDGENNTKRFKPGSLSPSSKGSGSRSPGVGTLRVLTADEIGAAFEAALGD